MEIKINKLEELERRLISRWGKKHSQEGVLKVLPPAKFVKYIDLLAEAWGWGMLVPYDHSVELPDYCSYLEHYYKENCNAITEVTGSNLVDVAETCLKKENELVSLWDSKSKEWTDGFLPRKNYILSSLIQEFAGKVKRTGEGISVASTAALLCITKEANLICEMLNYGASPTDYLIIQSTEIRMCALSLMSHQYGVPAAAAMVGIMKETDKICDWLSKNKEPFDPCDIDLDNDFELGRHVRIRTLHLMISILAESPFSVPAAAGHKLVEEKSFSGNVPRNDGNDITPAEAANTTWDNLKDQEKITGADISRRRMEGTNKEANDQELGSCQSRRKLSKTGCCHNLGLGDDPVVPLRREYLMGSSEDIRENQMVCSDEDRRAFDFSSEDLEVGCDAARYYKCNANFVAELTGSLVASAEVCLKKEEQLVSLWKARVGYFPNEIWPVNSIIQSNLIQKRANSIICATGGKHSVASTIAFACITKEADLMCELLKHGAGPTDDIIQQSSVNRMCALALWTYKGSISLMQPPPCWASQKSAN